MVGNSDRCGSDAFTRHLAGPRVKGQGRVSRDGPPGPRSPSSVFVPPAALPSAILTLKFVPYQRGIYCDDQSIKYPYRRDTISHGTMAAVTITCSIVIVSPASRIWTAAAAYLTSVRPTDHHRRGLPGAHEAPAL